MKKLYALLIIAMLFQLQVNAQERKLIKYQYSPNKNTKIIKGQITSTFNSYFENTKMYWFKLNGDTVIHVWENDLDTNMRVGKVYTFKGLQKMIYKIK